MTTALIPDDNSIYAIIPAYNEGARVCPVIEETALILPVIVIDDGSSDDTADQAETTSATVIRQQPNQGKGAALRMGFRYALDQGADAVVTLDADGQHAPDEITYFLDAYAGTGADLIIGSRDFGKMPAIRRASNTVGRWLFSWAVGADIPDNQSGFRLLSRRLMADLLESDEYGFEFEVEMISVCIQRGYQLGWVPISTIYADETSHIQPMRHVQEYLRVIRETRRKRKGTGP